jgi:hypothetical protein
MFLSNQSPMILKENELSYQWKIKLKEQRGEKSVQAILYTGS